jgi:TatD DNase family protein
MTDPVAIGEIGLDFYRSTDNADEQCFVFERQLEMAARFDLPVIIHQRSAEDQVLEILAVKRPPRGVMHCFTGDYEFADRCLDLGLYLGIGGVATFPRSDAIRTAIRSAPDDRLLLETDAPFLAPQSRRGKRNESSYLPEVVDAIAKTRNSSSHEASESGPLRMRSNCSVRRWLTRFDPDWSTNESNCRDIQQGQGIRVASTPS